VAGLIGLTINLLLRVGLGKKLNFNPLLFFLGGIFFLPRLVTVIIMPFLKLGKFILRESDHGWLEYFGGQGVIGQVKTVSLNIDKFNILGLKLYLSLFFIIIIVCFILYLDSL